MQDGNGCGAFLWKDEVANWHLAEANSTTCERENWREEKPHPIRLLKPGLEKQKNTLEVSCP